MGETCAWKLQKLLKVSQVCERNGGSGTVFAEQKPGSARKVGTDFAKQKSWHRFCRAPKG